MADEPLTIQGIHWREAFPFTHLFRAFRVAIHPSKVVLALVALLFLYCGGRLLDAVWLVADRAVPGEVVAFEAFQKEAKPGDHFADYRAAMRSQVESLYSDKLLEYKVVSDRAAADAAAKPGEDLGALKDKIKDRRTDAVAAALKVENSALAQAAKLDETARLASEKTIRLTYDATVKEAYDNAENEFSQAKQIKNEGLFDHYFSFEANQVSSVVRGVRDWNWFGTEQTVLPENSRIADALSAANTLANPLGNPLAGTDQLARADTVGIPGVIQSIIRFFTVGPVWLFSQHPLYFACFGLYSLVLWAIFGGAISRIAAVHVARDEKLSIRAALKFSVSKFLSFLFAPLIPVIIIAAIGGVTAVGALIGNIPLLGPIVVGALFFLALIAGFLMALVLLGLIGGFNLMYPTVAVEGSDSFDAISRSFSYLYARPWRLAFYTIVSVVYGALTYLFVRLFIFVMLVLTHKFVSLGFLTHADSTAPLWSTMWPNPNTAARLSYDVNFLTLHAGQDVAAFLVSFWVYLVIAILGAFAISFYFSSNTIIYLLMRREVDATEMDDVYLEQVEDDYAEPGEAASEEAAAKPASQTAAASDASDIPPPT